MSVMLDRDSNIQLFFVSLCFQVCICLELNMIVVSILILHDH